MYEKASHRQGENICKSYIQQRYPGYIKKSKLSSKKTNNPVRKWAKYLNKHFTSEDPWMTNIHMKRCSTSLAIRKMQIKAPIRYHYTSIRMAKVKKNTDNTGNKNTDNTKG